MLDKAYIDNDWKDVFVTCPNCNHCEEMPIDQKRSLIQTFTISWMSTLADETQKSFTRCRICDYTFILYWKYKEVPTPQWENINEKELFSIFITYMYSVAQCNLVELLSDWTPMEIIEELTQKYGTFSQFIKQEVNYTFEKENLTV